MSFQSVSQNVTVHDQEVSRSRNRLFFIDYLRVALTILVIMHHLAITYGGVSVWYYQEPTKDPLVFTLLSLFLFVNQSFFMGLFFLIAAYFTPGSYERKGARTFLLDRLLRLGLPLVIFTFVLNPFIVYIGVGAPLPYGQFLLRYGVNAIGPGPLWFVEALLLFDCVYVLWRWLRRKLTSPLPVVGKAPVPAVILLFTLGLAIVTFLVRFVFPFGWTVPLINFIPSNFPQYISLFIVGLLAAQRGWFQSLPSWLGKVGLAVALGATIVLLPLALIGSSEFAGGLHWQAFIYALWESIMGVGMSMGLLVLFRQRLNRPGRVGKFFSANAYTVYIIHALIIVCVALAIQTIHLYPLLKFVLAVLISVPLCFGCAYLLRKAPFVRSFL